MAVLVPELAVADVERSLWFWCEILGFEVDYARPEERFARILLGNACVMLDQISVGRTWRVADFVPPLGRGINFEIEVDDLDAVLARLREALWPLFMEPEEKWYRTGDVETGVRQFLVQDPDGYLVRPPEFLGERRITL